MESREQECLQLLNATRSLARQMMGRTKGDRLADTALSIHDIAARQRYLRGMAEDLLDNKGSDQLRFPRLQNISKYKFEPVDIRTFICDDYYLALGDQAFEPVLRDLEEMNNGEYVEAVLTGGIGAAKTTAAIWTTAYQIYLLSALRDPHGEYGQDKNTEILIIIQSIRKELAEKVDYARLRSLLENSPYFQNEFPFSKEHTSEMKFPSRIIVRPVSGSDTAAIGQNVIGGIIDEMNYMAVIEKSKQSSDKGTYDQAVSLYNSISRRRKSRFMNQGKMPGILCLVSSRKYPGQFTDKKEEERLEDIRRYGKSPIYLYDKRVWDIKPHDFSGEFFSLFTGTEYHKPRIIADDETPGPQELGRIMQIPVEYREDFERDMQDSLREIAGVSTLALHPYMPDADAVSRCFSKNYKSVLSDTVCDFEGLKIGIHKKRIRNKSNKYPRYAHIDLGITGDSAGLAIGHVEGFRTFKNGPEVERRPVIAIDCTLEIKPPPNGEILFYKIRRLLYMLRDNGMPIEWVSFDNFQSADGMQLLKQKGFRVGYVSMDTTEQPYKVTKDALYDGRVKAPEHELVRNELLGLEYDAKKGKVDHRPDASKDVSDALAGVVYGLTTRRKIYALHKISMKEVSKAVEKTTENEAVREERKNKRIGSD